MTGGPARVAHVITKLELGGAQRHVLDLVARMDRRLFTPLLVTGPEGELLGEARSLGAEIAVAPSLERPLKPLRDLSAWREIAGILRRPPGVRLVHTNSSKAGIVGRMAARSAGVPAIVHTVHGWGVTPAQPPPLRAALVAAERAAARVTTRFVAVSRRTLEEGERMRIVPPGRGVVIRSGVDLASFASAAPDRARLEREAGIPAAAPLVLMPACLKPQKDPLCFVRAAALVRRDHPEARFAVAGDGELAAEVRAEAARLGLSGALHLLGWRRDMPSLMAGAAVVVLTSRWEGLPQVIPQARAAGRPLVVTAVDGSPEAVREGVEGFLVPPRDPAAAAARISLLLSDPALARRMGEAGREGLGEFSRDEMVRRHEALYRELLGSGPWG